MSSPSDREPAQRLSLSSEEISASAGNVSAPPGSYSGSGLEDRPLYSIGTAARKSGVSASAIRSWEERYGVVTPQRDASGRRLYTATEVAQLSWLGRQVAAGVSASEAHRLLAADPQILGETSLPVSREVALAWPELSAWVADEEEWLSAFLTEATLQFSAPSFLFGVLYGGSRGPLLVLLLEPSASEQVDEMLSSLDRSPEQLSALPLRSVPQLSAAPLLETMVSLEDPFGVGAASTVVSPVVTEASPALLWVSFTLPTFDGDASSVQVDETLVSAASVATRSIAAYLSAAQARSTFTSLMR